MVKKSCSEKEEETRLAVHANMGDFSRIAKWTLDFFANPAHYAFWVEHISAFQLQRRLCAKADAAGLHEF